MTVWCPLCKVGQEGAPSMGRDLTEINHKEFRIFLASGFTISVCVVWKILILL